MQIDSQEREREKEKKKRERMGGEEARADKLEHQISMWKKGDWISGVVADASDVTGRRLATGGRG